MFASRKKHAVAAPQIWLNPGAIDRDTLPVDPEDQAQLVSSALQQLEQVQRMVRSLEDVPGGNRQDLLDELATAADGLRQLFFVDAIY